MPKIDDDKPVYEQLSEEQKRKLNNAAKWTVIIGIGGIVALYALIRVLPLLLRGR